MTNRGPLHGHSSRLVHGLLHELVVVHDLRNVLAVFFRPGSGLKRPASLASWLVALK